MDAIFIIIGLAIGFLIGWIIAKSRNTDKLIDLNKQVAAKDEKIDNLNKQLEQQGEKLITEFENLASKILKQNTTELTETNQKKLTDMLDPLKEKITIFEKKVEETYVKGTKERSVLAAKIADMTEVYKKMSEDATNLTNALKGESKTRGDWGEFRLELILEKAGLQKDIHYVTQETLKDDEGVLKKPDCIIKLPDNRHIIIDSKVSLNSYEAYYNTDDDNEKEGYLKKHLENIKDQIRDLGSKNYQNLYQINTPDYVLMYIPVEPALTLALQNDQELCLNALDKNIVLVTASTLLATMRTVSFIWKQENQKKNVLEIARQSGALYDKFKGFIDDLFEVGSKLISAKNSYDNAMNKLSEGKGNLVKRSEEIKKLGAKTTKSLSQQLLDKAYDEETGTDISKMIDKPQE